MVSHDAGGAEVLSAWCGEQISQVRLFLCVRGPAKTIFHRDWPDLPLVSLDFISGMSKDDLVLTGTSLEDRTEFQAWQSARGYGIPSVCVLDHWDMYRERFPPGPEFEATLPDRIWVGDKYAMEKALVSGFPMEKLVRFENPYFRKIVAQAHNVEHAGVAAAPGLRLLYICEPVSLKLSAAFPGEDHLYANELEMMTGFLKECGRHTNDVTGITIRLHPRESGEKYRQIIERDGAGLPVRLSHGTSLVEDIVGHDVVVGIESMGLVVAALLGKKVFSCIPGKWWNISLPHREINRVHSFDNIFTDASRSSNQSYNGKYHE